jgi:TPR repeat protein
VNGRPVRFLEELQAIVTAARRQHKEPELRQLGRELEDEYARISVQAPELRTLEAQLALADLGPAALAIGKHLLVHDDPRAKRWLHLAAECRVGDAAYRLAKFYEHEEVKRFNLAMDRHSDGDPLPEPALMSEASRWFGRAGEEGYGNGFDVGNAGEGPALALDCCQPVAYELQRGVAAELVEAARGDAAEIIETARADARVIREDCQAMLAVARTEFSMLTARSRALEEIIRQQAATLQELVTEPDPPSWTVRSWWLARWFRRPGRRGR